MRWGGLRLCLRHLACTLSCVCSCSGPGNCGPFRDRRRQNVGHVHRLLVYLYQQQLLVRGHMQIEMPYQSEKRDGPLGRNVGASSGHLEFF